MEFRISIGMEDDATLIEILGMSYSRVGTVAMLTVFKWCPYASVGNAHYILGFVIKGS